MRLSGGRSSFEVMSSLAESAPVGGPLAVIEQADAALSELTQASWWAVSDADLLRAAIEVETQRRKLEASRLVLLAEVQARGAAVAAGARSTAGWLVAATRLGHGEARRVVRSAAQLAELAPAVRAALATGTIGVGHAVAITQVLRGAAGTVDPAQAPRSPPRCGRPRRPPCSTSLGRWTRRSSRPRAQCWWSGSTRTGARSVTTRSWLKRPGGRSPRPRCPMVR